MNVIVHCTLHQPQVLLQGSVGALSLQLRILVGPSLAATPSVRGMRYDVVWCAVLCGIFVQMTAQI